MTHHQPNFKTRTSRIRRLLVWLLAWVLSAAGVSAAQEPPDTNYDESKAPQYELPDPLVCSHRHLRTRRVLYNFDGDSCLFTKAGGKGPVPVNVDDVKRLIEEVAYDGSRVDTVLVCVNAQVMYYPTKVGTMRGTLSTPEERRNGRRRRSSGSEQSARRSSTRASIRTRSCWPKRSGAAARRCSRFRMNDDHGNDFLRTQFLVDHPDWRLGTEQYRGRRDGLRPRRGPRLHVPADRGSRAALRLRRHRTRLQPLPDVLQGRHDRRTRRQDELAGRAGSQDARRSRTRTRAPAGARASGCRRTTADPPPTPETARQIGCDVPPGRRTAGSISSRSPNSCSNAATCRSPNGSRPSRRSRSTAASKSSGTTNPRARVPCRRRTIASRHASSSKLGPMVFTSSICSPAGRRRPGTSPRSRCFTTWADENFDQRGPPGSGGCEGSARRTSGTAPPGPGGPLWRTR